MFDTLKTLDSDRIDYLPTPDEIDRACRSIREGWSRNEQRRRFVGPQLPDELPAPWQPPLVDTTAFRMSLSRGPTDS